MTAVWGSLRLTPITTFRFGLTTRSMQWSAVSCVVSVLLLVGPSRSQAPGDADTVCTVTLVTQHPVYPNYIRVLMDSANYQNLIATDTSSPGPVWQTVDIDNIDTMAIRVSWTETQSFGCEHQLEVCGFLDLYQDNWLITQHINRTLPSGDRLEQVEVTIEYQFIGCTSDTVCSTTFKVYKYDTSTINPAAARVVGNFGGVPVAVVAPTDQLGGVQTQTISLTYSSTDTDSGFYLAIRDQNSCLTISRVLVFYDVCPAEVQNLVQFDELLALPNIPQNEAISVLAQCIPNASPVSQTGEVRVICSNGGAWQINPGSGCECDSGTKPNNDGSQCIGCPAGQYMTQDFQCTPCPNNTNTTFVNGIACPCLPRFFRAASDDPGRLCTRPPSSPRNLVIIAGPTTTSVTLSWAPPTEDGGRPSDIITYGFHAQPVGDNDIVMLGYVNETNGTVEGMFPFTEYIVYVSSENGVSGMEPDILGRSASIQIMTLIGKPPSSPRNLVIITGPTNTSVTLSWAPPTEDGDRPSDIITYGFHAQLVGDDVIVKLGYVNETNGTVGGLFPFTEYTVYVSSENGVSGMDPGILGRSASVQIMTLIGIPSIVRNDSIAISGNTLSWAVPEYPGGVILHYDILFLSTNTIASVMITPGSVAVAIQVGPEETYYSVAEARLPSGNYFVRIRAVTVTGAGMYSDPVGIMIQRESSTTLTVMIGTIVASSLLVIFVLVVVTVIVALAYFRRKISQQSVKDTNEYTTVDYMPPALPPPRLPKPSLQLSEFSATEMQQNAAYQQGLQLDKSQNVDIEQNSAYEQGLGLDKPEYVAIVEY